MATLVKAKDGDVLQYPYTVADFRREHPNVSIPKDPTAAQLAEFDLYKVGPGSRPPSDLAYDVVEDAEPIEVTPNNWVRSWSTVPVSAEELARRQLTERTNTEQASVKADNFVQNFIKMTPAEVMTYVDNNVTDLPSAKSLLEKMAVMLLLLARREFKE